VNRQFLVSTAVIALGWVVKRLAGLGSLVLFRNRPRAERGQLAMLLPGFNIGLFAYPLVEAALGPGALAHLGMFDMGVAFVTFGLAFGVASHFGLLLNVANVASHLLLWALFNLLR